MNKKSIKFLITIAFIFLLIPNVNAFVNKGNHFTGCDVNINMEEPGTTTGYHATGEYCIISRAKWDGTYFDTGSDGESFKTADAAFESWQDEYIGYDAGPSGKPGDGEVIMTRCQYPDQRYVLAETNCDTVVRVSAKRDCTWHNVWDSNQGKYVSKENCGPYYCTKGNLVDTNKCEYESRWDLTRRITLSNGQADEYGTKDLITSKCLESSSRVKCTCEPKYTLYCPHYICPVSTAPFKACTPSLVIPGDDVKAYCVNPNDEFDEGAPWKADTNFDVYNCRTSYSTVDCGYANILIEGNYQAYKDPDNEAKWQSAIEYAMRLWTAHSNGSGVYGGKIGLSNLIYLGEGSESGRVCSDDVRYTDNNKNVYGESYTNLYDKFLKLVTKYMTSDEYKKSGYIDPSIVEEKFSIKCAGTYNMICEGGSADRGFALFFNTVMGNKYMKEHLSELYDGSIYLNLRPNNVGVETDDSSETTTVVVTYDYENPIEVNTEEKMIDCSRVDQDYSYLSDEQRDYIKQYCSVKVEKLYLVYSDGHEEEISVDDNNKFFDASKGTLRVKAKYYAVCKENSYKNYRVVIDYPKQKPPVQKFIACAETRNQHVYVFYKKWEEPATSPEGSETPDEEYFVGINCSNVCNEYQADASIPKCQLKDNSIYTGYVRDPSLKCIVNMGSAINKGYYDYSTYFGVNTNLCRVYCSDEVNYYIADKLTINSGLSFKYDIKPAGLYLDETDKLISSVIEEKRTCVSEIYFKKNFPTTPDWEGLYGITQGDINDALKDQTGDKKYIKNWQDLYKVISRIISEEGKDKEGGSKRTENLIQLVYDLYNCNFAKESEIPVRRPDNNKVGNVYENIKNIYKKNDPNNPNMIYGLDLSKWQDQITYEGGAKYITSGSYVGNNANDIQMEKNTGGYMNEKRKYCSDGAIADCLAYKDPSGNSKIKEENYSYSNFKEYDGVGKTTNFMGRVVPTNDYAMFEVVTQVAFYNNSEFQVQSYTGNVMNKNEGIDKSLIPLEKFIYPMSKEAYNVCTASGDNNTRRCSVYQNFSGITTFYRIRQMDDFAKKVNSFNKFECAIDVKVPQVSVNPDYGDNGTSTGSGKGRGEETIYRNVELSNLFPNELSEKSTTNWSMPYGIQATKDIENSAKDINTNKYLEYRVELTPETIKEIKDYNKKMENFGGYTNDSYDHSTCEIKDNKFFNCESIFLQNIRNGRERFGIDPNINKLDGLSEYTKELKDLK